MRSNINFIIKNLDGALIDLQKILDYEKTDYKIFQRLGEIYEKKGINVLHIS